MPLWAGYLRGRKSPVQGERPAAYIIVLADTEINQASGVDHATAAQQARAVRRSAAWAAD